MTCGIKDFAVTAYDTTKSIESGYSNEVVLTALSLSAALEGPSEGSYENGIGLIRGWVCNAARVEVEIDGKERLATAYGTRRADTAATCGGADTGYGLTFNWNLLGDGLHRLRAFADGVEFANVGFRVTTLGQDFLRDAPEREFTLSDFPRPGDHTAIRWSPARQNFVIVGLNAP